MQIKSLVGYTESNKPIYQYEIGDPKELSKMFAGFSQVDHFDAVAIFSYLQLVFWRKYGEDSRDYASATTMLNFHDSLIPKEFKEGHAIKLGIITIFGLVNYGRNHCVSYLHDTRD